jgi:acyl carrier protein
LEKELDRITEIIRDLFDEYDGPVTRDLSARDIEQWDSLLNVQLVVQIERVFGIRFNSHEVGQFKNLGELLDIIRKKSTKTLP